MSKESSWLCVAIPIVTAFISFVLGFFASRFTMSKKERKDYSLKLQENSNKLSVDLDEKFQIFTAAIGVYNQKKFSPDPNDFFEIATKGESYFAQCRAICDSILSGIVDKKSIENTHLPIVKDVIEKSLPVFYDTLQDISKKNSIQYDGILKKENYKSIYEVYDKYNLKDEDKE